MMRSLFAGVSGLKNHQTRMDVIGNNIANVNTTGFKGSRVTFQDMLSQTISGAAAPQGDRGGTNPQQIGLGVGIGSIDTIFTDGSVQGTGKNTDLAISGNGFFIMSDGAKDYYTRNGAFEFDKQGNYVLPGSGLRVKGWMADANGNVSSSGALTNIVVPSGQTMPSKESTKSVANGNLAATEKVPTSETKTGLLTKPGEPAPVVGTKTTADDGTVTEITSAGVDKGAYYTMSVPIGTIVTTDNSVNPPVTTTVPVPVKAGDTIYDKVTGAAIGTVTRVANGNIEYLTSSLAAAAPTAVHYKDSNGVLQILSGKTVTIAAGGAKTEVDNAAPALTQKSAQHVYEYSAKIDSPGARKDLSIEAFDSQGIKHTIPGTLEKTATNTWIFTPKSLADTGAVVTGTPITVTFDANGKCIAGKGSIMITPIDPPLGSSTLSIDLDFTGLTQYSGTSSVNMVSDGNAAGTLDKVDLDTSGMVVGTFSNGMKRNLAQVAIGTFNNPAGLEKAGSSLYTQSNNSGNVQINVAGSGGAGKLTPASIEMSNVNLSDQFSDMIITQRGFQSNSKIITVSDEMIETLVNMKR